MKKQRCHEPQSSVIPIIIFFVVVLLAGVGLLLWQVFGRGPRLGRALARARRAVQSGSIHDALQIVQAMKAEPNLPSRWQKRLRMEAGEFHQRAADEAIKERRFEEAWSHSIASAREMELDEDEHRARVLDAMLAEVRRAFASWPEHNDATLELINRLFALQSPCAEATFWQGLCQIRSGDTDGAIASLTLSFDQSGRQFLDPPLYLGMLQHRLGRPQDALRSLAEANKIDASCSFVTMQMGMSLVAANGDSGLAMRALQRALGMRGLALWLPHPERAWIEAFPETKSYVRRLASRYAYTCPILGGDLNLIIRQGQLSLAQAYYRQNNFQEAADLYAKLMQDSAPTLGLLRGLGLSLARLTKYDQAYKHLRAAMEMDGGQDAITAGYLALCGAMGRPTNPDDKPKNISWSLRLLARYQLPGNAEWAGLNSAVQAEARTLRMALSQDDQLRLCDLLAAVPAFDPQAAEAYAYLQATYPDAVVPIYAWLYVRAATVHGVQAVEDLALFARTFRSIVPAREFFHRQNWDFDDVEYTYLVRAAAAAPGRFPEAMGGDYPPRGEVFLLERSTKEEGADKKDEALKCVEVLLRVMPDSVLGHDRLACLHYRRGDLDRAASFLVGWQKLAPRDPWPLIRQAVLEQQRGNAQRRAEVIDHALGLTRGPQRAAVAFLGAKLALKESAKEWAVDKAKTDGAVQGPDALRNALTPTMNLLQECLKEDPEHVEAQWCLAAVRSVLGDRSALASQASVMNRPAVKDARFHFLGAVCHLAARDYAKVVELSQRAATADDSLTAECHYLMGWAYLYLKNASAAETALQKVAAADKNPSAVHARALLGSLGFARGAYDDAVKWWNAVDAKRRAEWKVDDPLRNTVLLAGLLAFQKGRYEQAAERFREAGKLGLRDKRLGPMITLALVKAGQRLLYEQVK
jgi:tetratricopeptide (TPR) repeat protein